MLQIISGYKLEGLSIASIGMCQSLESIDVLVSDFVSRSDYPVISNVLDFFYLLATRGNKTMSTTKTLAT